MSALSHVSAMSLFVDDLAAAKTFYVNVFDVPVVYEDDSSVAVAFDKLIVNLLRVENAQEIIEPGIVGERKSGSRFQLSIWVDDVDAACVQLQKFGVGFTGPIDRVWGLRTVNFEDPAGHSWEIAQKIPAA